MTDDVLQRIVSSGQAGVDRAALDVALELGVPCGGWCPAGRRAEDGTLDPRYPMRETSSTGYVQPIEWNVRDTDGTLILTRGEPVGPPGASVEFAARMRKPCLVVDLDAQADPAAVVEWASIHAVRAVNICGLKESRSPEIYRHARQFLRAVLTPAPLVESAPVSGPERGIEPGSSSSALPPVAFSPVPEIIRQDIAFREAIIPSAVATVDVMESPAAVAAPGVSVADLLADPDRVSWSRFQTAAAVEGAVLFGVYQFGFAPVERAAWVLCGFTIVAMLSAMTIGLRRPRFRANAGGLLTAIVVLMNGFNVLVCAQQLSHLDARPREAIGWPGQRILLRSGDGSVVRVPRATQEPVVHRWSSQESRTAEPPVVKQGCGVLPAYVRRP